MAEITEREALSLKIRSTVQFEFGSACDLVAEQEKIGAISRQTSEYLQKMIRNRGNNIIRIIDNHLDYVNVSRNYAQEEINIPRVKRKITERLKQNG